MDGPLLETTLLKNYVSGGSPRLRNINVVAVAAAASVVYDERCWLEDISWRMQIALRWLKWQKWIQVKDVQGLRIFMIKVS